MPEVDSPPASEVVNAPIEFAHFMTPPFDRFADFGDLIHDKNPLHRDHTYALERKCAEPPVFGIALGALTDIAIEKFE